MVFRSAPAIWHARRSDIKARAGLEALEALKGEHIVSELAAEYGVQPRHSD